ncbi:hypothetical protein JRQ81_007449 [Phrynocephalus forsythii]|uniref:Uncharacterized protein n=1 Tax=Phrynocephalus forsythii TaxID=171643 RepID=A0A9Q0XDF7_9SAUR|nr:hypothetical protein JRQ81_007449 [Phrynocephalus forsythii]
MYQNERKRLAACCAGIALELCMNLPGWTPNRRQCTWKHMLRIFHLDLPASPKELNGARKRKTDTLRKKRNQRRNA